MKTKYICVNCELKTYNYSKFLTHERRCRMKKKIPYIVTQYDHVVAHLICEKIVAGLPFKRDWWVLMPAGTKRSFIKKFAKELSGEK